MHGVTVECPECGSAKYVDEGPAGIKGTDPLMRRVRCLSCKQVYFVTPPVNYREGGKNTGDGIKRGGQP